MRGAMEHEVELPVEPAVCRVAAGPLRGPILVATDGLAGADGAVHVARWLAAEHDAPVHVLSVLEPISVAYAAASGVVAPAPTEIGTVAQVLRQTECMRDQLARTIGDVAWPLDVRVGDPAQTIADVADELHASLIVMGLGRHGPVSRLIRGETALQVLQCAGVPILAVRPDTRPPLVRALAAVDFSRSSLRALRAVVPLLARSAQLWLAHVQPPLRARGEAAEGAGVIYTQGVVNSFRSLFKTLEAPDGLAMHPVLLEGDAARELAEFGQEHAVDVVVAGAHGHSLLERMLVGSVTTKLVRSSPRAVLAAPPVSAEQREGRQRLAAELALAAAPPR